MRAMVEKALPAVFAACVLLSCSGWLAVRGERQELLLVRSERVAVWFNCSSRDALPAALLALGDHGRLASAESASGGPPPVALQETAVGESSILSLGVNHSVVAIVTAECTDDNCHVHSSSHGIPVISVSPSCLGREGANTTMMDREPASEVTSDVPLCMFPSLTHLPRGTAALLSLYHWQRASVISELDSQLALSAEEVYYELDSAGITDIKQFSLSPHSPLSDVLHRDYRIVVLNSAPVLARRVLCEALHQNRTRHVWVTPGWYPRWWWKQREDAPVIESQSACSNRDLEQFIGRGGRVLSVLQSPSYSGNSSVWEEFQERCLEEGLEDCVYAGLAYDAVWAIASTLTASLSPAELHTALVGVEFDGVSGRVEFNSSYRVLGGYRVAQLRTLSDGSLQSVPVASLTEEEEEEGGELTLSYLSGETELTVWPEGVPSDGSPEEELKHPLTALVVLCSVLSGSVILWAVGCIIFNICFRKKKVIKLTSPTLNMMIAVGIILTNLTTPLSMYPPALEEALPAFCHVRSWVLPIGWSLSLCTITVKMWRVFVIYRTTRRLQSLKQKKIRKFLQDGYMVTLVLCMVVVDVIVLIIGTSLPQTRFSPKQVPDKEFPSYRNSDDVEVVYYNLQCVSEKGLIWVAFLFGYKIIFLVSGVVLAVLTRKVEVKGLNESREVQVTMIIAAPIVITGLILRLLLSDYLNVVGTVYALSGSLYGALILGIIFLPKMVDLYRNPSGDQIYGSRLYPSERSNSISRKDRSLTSTSLTSFGPTNSLKSLFRKGSVESGLGSSVAGTEEGKSERERKGTATTKHNLPTIEEGMGSNEATTDFSEGAAVEGKSFLLVQGEGGSSGHQEIILTEASLPTCLRNFNFTEEAVGTPSSTHPLIISQDPGISHRSSWPSTPPSPPSPITHEDSIPSPTVAGHNSRIFQSMFDSSGLRESGESGEGEEGENAPPTTEEVRREEETTNDSDATNL